MSDDASGGQLPAIYYQTCGYITETGDLEYPEQDTAQESADRQTDNLTWYGE